jgi:maleylacetoacetate isomerase
MVDDVVLYDYWRSSACYRVRLALGLLGIAYRKIPVDLLEDEQNAQDHLARNPQGLVPVLEIGGLRLTQSLAIIEYLADIYPHSGLLSEDSAGRARVRALSYAIAMEIHPICNLRVIDHVSKLVSGEASDAARAAWMNHFISSGLKAFDAMLDDPATGTFCHGDRPSMADLCLMPQIYNARRWNVDLQPFKRIDRVYTACERQEWFAAAYPARP